jgi:hypothetical protein
MDSLVQGAPAADAFQSSGASALDALRVFTDVTDGPAAVPYAVGWGLLVCGVIFSVIVEMSKIATSSKKPDVGEVIVSGSFAAIMLASYKAVCAGVWWATQGVAKAIYPDDHLETLGKMLGQIAERFQHYTLTFSVTQIAQGIKDSLVSVTAMASWALAVLSHWQIKQVQVNVYNVVFCFGPLLIGLSAWKLPTLKIWLTSLLEVSSWSITSAVLYFGLQSQFQRYLTTANQSTPNILDTRFLDAINGLIFLSSFMVIVPVVTGRLLGMGALGELGRVSNHSSWAAGMANSLRERLAAHGPQTDRSNATVTDQEMDRHSSRQRRPGD